MVQTAENIAMKVPAKPEYVGVVRLTVSGVASRLGYSYDDIEDIKIAVAEACTNVVNHAYTEQSASNDMHVNFAVHEDRLELVVADEGGAVDTEFFNRERGPVSKDQPVDELKEGGLGLFLIETLMDEVEIRGEKGVMIIMTKFLQRDEVEPNGRRASEESPEHQ
ncbi:anti-sigma B factor RsbW [Alkalicoccus saliphilus]|jgi:serine/threonine-protein kinase RsbW|uniref:Serine-protein kinase RsbW n=1 Tax=Alkalicoccus saliphilus TaxID=200989 RepID=A0A2T4U595_9BACI|nr:anti-sigma B factor RsbW [Alkalicoccus saliphilus]PTL38572.1 anti-sigma B factor RsbW [Alkalicoccus saliphilus]